MNDQRRHQQSTGRSALGPGARLRNAVATPLLRLLIRLLIASCRVREICGQAHLDGLIVDGRAALLCCWHQRLAFCVAHLLRARRDGLKPGFLVSPSRDGELVAAVVGGLGAQVVRGSANRTGARALRETHAILRAGISPIMPADGPHGPAHKAKPGSLMLAQMTRAPLLPMSFAADRYWQLKSWDALIVPKPFARIAICIGEPIEVARGDNIESRAAILTQRLDALDAAADNALLKP